jgi:hypothetical protein
MPHPQQTTSAMLGDISAMLADPPRSVAERISDVYVEDAEAGRVTEERDLLRLGFTLDEIRAHAANASTIASTRLTRRQGRDIRATPVRSVAEIERDMADVIASQLPATVFLVHELQGRGFSKSEIDLLFPKARARAALSFCHGRGGETN